LDHGRRRRGHVEGIWGVQTRRHGREPPSQQIDQAPGHVNCDRPGPRLNEFHATLLGQRRNRPGRRRLSQFVLWKGIRVSGMRHRPASSDTAGERLRRRGTLSQVKRVDGTSIDRSSLIGVVQKSEILS
jgi:hypothetical protein